MKIALLSRGRTLYSTRRIADTARRRRHEVSIIDPYRSSFGIVDNKLVIYHGGEALTGFDVVIPRIGASSLAHSVAMLRQFELTGVPAVNGSEGIVSSKDKLHAQQILAAGGVGVPHTMTTRDPAQLPALIRELGGPPVVIKVLKGTQGVGVAITDSIESARSVVQTLWSLDQELVIQEYIAEARGSDIRTFVVNGKVVGAMRRVAPKDDFRANLHGGGTSTKVKLSSAMKEAAIKSAELLKLDVAGVDLLESERGPLVLEANASPGL